jgi:Kdo2-lipid IVA lauroyltransferase/acyltransferase
MLKLATVSQRELSRRMIFRNVQIIESYKKQNQSILILASHHFNWEWLLAAGNFSLPISLDFVYQPLSNSFFDRFSLMCRTRFGAYPIKRDEVARATVKRKDILRGIAIVADQYPGLKNDKRHFIQFLNQRTAFFLGANQLASVTQYPVVYVEMRKSKRGYYEATFREIAVPPFAKEDFTVIENYAQAVEKIIQENPAEWLWSHNRWKKKHERRMVKS